MLTLIFDDKDDSGDFGDFGAFGDPILTPPIAPHFENVPNSSTGASLSNKSTATGLIEHLPDLKFMLADHVTIR